jgi:chlorite dismutase
MSEQISRPAPEGAPAPSGRARLEPPDISERGGQKGGQPQRSDERLFVQLTAYGECRDVGAVCSQLGDAGIDAVVYEDLNDARGIALLAIHRDPNFFLDTLRPVLNAGACAALTRKPEFTLFGRTYALGYEPDLDEVLFARPRRTVLNPAWRWAIWYPLRRNGAFARLPIEQQRVILAEHGEIGMRFGAADYVHDVRLACHGLDKEDNDFVIGLIGKELHPLSAVVEAMRKTQQTSLYLDRLGPFFVGRTIWQAAE